ncbi:MAG: HEAT repeat domain-containing protein, partial [Gemmataceae bacterium]
GTRVAALAALPTHGMTADAREVRHLLNDKDDAVRAQAVWLLGLVGDRDDQAALELLLAGPATAFVKRRACEALVRLGVEPKVEAVWPLLGSDDPYLRTAARLVVERIDPAKWVDRVKSDTRHQAAWQGIVALCKAGKAAAHGDAVFARLAQPTPSEGDRTGWLRTVQLGCFHVAAPPAEALGRIARECDGAFPATDPGVNRELAILLAHFRRTGVLKTAVQSKLIDAILAAKDDRAQQIHYFYCLRFLHDGWTADEQARLAAWYESTRDWKGGHSFTPFLENIFRECLLAYDVKARQAIVAKIEAMPQANLVLAQRQAIDRAPGMLADVKRAMMAVADKQLPRVNELRAALSDAALKTVIEHPKADYLPDLIGGVSSANKLTAFECLAALQKVDARPKPDDAAAYRAVLLAAGRLDAGNRWKAVEVLRHWSGGRQFGGETWEPELKAWTRWYAQAFPKESPLPGLADGAALPSKYKFADLLAHVTTGPGKAGDATKGRAVFEKASCLKCHKYGKEGEGVGPDLTTLSKRFKRSDTLEALYYPSKVISDQYRSTAVVTKRGVRVEGLLAVTGDQVTVLQPDATKVTLRLKDIEQRFASLTSVMPEKVLDGLTLAEIADLFAFLESDPGK